MATSNPHLLAHKELLDLSAQAKRWTFRAYVALAVGLLVGLASIVGYHPLLVGICLLLLAPATLYLIGLSYVLGFRVARQLPGSRVWSLIRGPHWAAQALLSTSGVRAVRRTVVGDASTGK